MNIPAISVVMSVHNGEPFLGEAIESVIEQSFTDWEFIAIDDGSTDGSGQTIDSYAVKDERLIVCHQENTGLIDALNFGCKLARGRYIARMDADDVAMRDRLQRQVIFMDENPQVGVVGSAIEVINGAGQAVATHCYPTGHHQIIEGLRKGDCPLVHPSVLFRKDVFDSVGGYKMGRVDAEDYDLWVRIAHRSQLANLDAVLLKYRRHRNQISIQRAKQQALTNLAVRTIEYKGGIASQSDGESSAKITRVTLTEMGVSEVAQNNAVVRGCVSAISSMYEAREWSATHSMINELLGSMEWKDAGTPVMADLRLLEMRLYWRELKFLKSILSLIQGVLTRPIIIARPIKPFVTRITRLLRVEGQAP